MGPQFLNRVFHTSVVLSLGLGVIAAFYFGWKVGLDFGMSALWGALGFWALRLLLVEATRPEGARLDRLALAGLLKVSLYAAGLLFLIFMKPNALAVIAGVPLVLAVIVLKSLSRVLLESEWFTRPMANQGGRR